ncbi:MAG: tetratricopeptide repeat protein [Steroidobacter sp.]
MRSSRVALVVGATLLAACSSQTSKDTLATLRNVPADTRDVQVEGGLDAAMQSYQRFLEQTPESERSAEAMRRLADLKIEKEYGINGDGDLKELPAPADLPAPVTAVATAPSEGARLAANVGGTPVGSEQDLEKRASAQQRVASAEDILQGPQLAEDIKDDLAKAGPLEAIQLYDRLLAKYPSHEHNDRVLYQKARAYDELGRTTEAMQVMEQLIAAYPNSRHVDELLFRRGEHFFARKKFRDAESSYERIIAKGPSSEYYELGLYKLGWSLYKQDLYDEALHRYVALLDYKVSVGYDFDGQHDEGNERRIADTFDIISLSFSNLGGPQIVQEYFTTNGKRGYEDRVYRNLGEYYLTKLRYHDAAKSYNTFIAQYPLHRRSPHFSMRVIEIYETGRFPQLVLDSKKAFASAYGLNAEYWRHFDVKESPEVLSYLKGNLRDLANHYHAQYQNAQPADKKVAEAKLANYVEATRWYREYINSFRADAETPGINYQLADLQLEHQDFSAAATEYQRTAYEYPVHERASAAGYAAIYAHREYLKVVGESNKLAARRDTVASSLKFADTFPEHEHAAVVLGAAADDLYDMKDFAPALSAGRKLIDRYPGAAAPVRRSAWMVVAHSSLELADYPNAEQGYVRVLELTPSQDESHAGLVENLAAAIYKQGEQANEQGNYRAAADHFLRIKQAAPTAKIRAAAEYDAGAALIRLEDWATAANVLDAFRQTYPQHELNREATKQIALVYRKAGDLSRSAQEYERVAVESDNPELRAEAMLLAGQLYQEASDADRALAAYSRYVEQFPKPVEAAIETRFKIAEIYQGKKDLTQYHAQLEQIVRIDAAAGADRTSRTRFLAARSGLVLAQRLYESFAELKLLQPFEQSLEEKQRRMTAATNAFAQLVDYQIGEVTAAATFYLGEVYSGFSRALRESERPANLAGSKLRDYEDALDEEAFPFEEKAIKVHEKNLELMTASKLYNPWIEQSLARLAVLMPGRYAKTEISSVFLASIDRYAYRSPSAPDTSPGAVADGAAPDTSGTPSQKPLPAVALQPIIEKTVSTGGTNATPH